jgi:N-acetylmuramoyl-L-alanine amidase
VLSVKWIKAAALALALVICFAAVWFAWLQPGYNAPAPSNDSIPTAAPVETPVPEPEPTPLPHAAACSPGDTGDNVKILQDMMIVLGFDPGKADGVYGGQVKAAVRNFQLYAGLAATGVADGETAAALTQRWQAAQQPQAAQEQPLTGRVIGIDPGHQRNPNAGQEPISPGSSETKDKVSKGTEGQFTGIPEYVVNLQVALRLKAALEALGARVVMTRESHGVDLSNAQRAKMMNEAGVDCWLRIHANYSPNPNNHGMFILVPPKGGLDTDDPFVVERSALLAETLLQSTLETTGAESDRLLEQRGDQTGFG